MVEDGKQKEIDNCYFVKAVLMLAVVAQHAVAFWADGFLSVARPVCESKMLYFFNEWLSNFHIWTFALVSGYVFYYVKYEKQCYNDFATFIKKKFQRLLIPAYFVGLVWIIPFNFYFDFASDATVNGMIKNGGGGIEWWAEAIKNLLVGLGNCSGQLWFLFMLFTVFVMGWFLSPLFKKYTWQCALFVLAIYVMGRSGKKYISNYYQIWAACSYLTYFFVGFKIRQYGMNWIRKIPTWGLLMTTILLVGASIWSDFNQIKLLSRVLTYTTRLVNAVLIFEILQRLGNEIDWEKCYIFRILEKYNFGIYLFHMQFVFLSMQMFNGMYFPFINALINFLIGVLGALVITTILNKWKITRILIGM